jgi:hypothetical protein
MSKWGTARRVGVGDIVVDASTFLPPPPGEMRRPVDAVHCTQTHCVDDSVGGLVAPSAASMLRVESSRVGPEIVYAVEVVP